MTVPRSIFATLALFLALSFPTNAFAQDGGSGQPRVDLHVGTNHEECYFDLHPELTVRQFRQFAAEGGQIARFRQLSGAQTLGAGTVDIGLGYSRFFLDDTKGAWNNTMSHPDADHYLGQQLGFPYLELRVGVTDRVDAEVYGAFNWTSNYGFVGVASKIRLVDERRGPPVSVAVRPSVSALLGPSEVQAYNLSTDLSLSRTFHGFTPFVGATLSATLAVENSPDTDVGNQAAFRPVGFVGFEYRWRFISLAVQGEYSSLPAFAAHLGGSF